MELYQLKSFVVVAEEGNLRRAADRLFASQPAVSGHIKALEEELGLALFERSRNGMLLTPDGERIHEVALRMLADAREIEATAHGLRDEVAGTIRIGVNNDGRNLRLDDTTAVFAEIHPELHFEFESGSSGSVLKGIRNEDIDVGYIELQPTEGDVTLSHLRLNNPVIVYPTKWHDDLNTDSWAALLSKPWAFVSKECSYCKLMHEAVAARGLELDWQYRADHETVTVSLVNGGVAVSMISRELAQPHVDAGRIQIWPHFSPSIPLSIACLSRRASEKTIVAYIKTVTELFSAEPSVR